jgi:hypothetical protein
MRQFSVIYNIKGTKIVDVYLPDGVELPSDWDSLKTEEQDEFLYNHQSHSVLRTEDLDYGKVFEIWENKDMLKVVK